MMYSCLDSFIYRLFHADAYHNSKTKTEIGFSIYDSSTMEGLNHQPTKWNGSELNCEVFRSVSLAEKRNLLCRFCVDKKAILNMGDFLTIP